MVISGFPAIGKTYYQKNKPTVLDSDSSAYSWISDGVRHPEFPTNYMDYIKSNIPFVDIILVSSHQVVRDALFQNKIDFLLAYPDRELKKEYLERCENRGSDKGFLALLNANWDQFIAEMEGQKGCQHLVLQQGEYPGDALSRRCAIQAAACWARL